MQTLYPESKDEWLKIRLNDVTSTEVSALFGVNPYISAYELYHQKKNAQVVTIEGNERMTWGLRLESSVAHGIAEDYGLKIRKLNAYIRHDTVKMGGSFDYEIVAHENGPGVLEIKIVDKFIYKRDWLDGEAPPHIELQLQQQLAVTNRKWGIIAALIGGNELVVLQRDRNEKIIASMTRKINKFWTDLEAGNEPSPDYDRDAKLLISMYAKAGENTIEAYGNNELKELACMYKQAGEKESSAKKEKESVKARILEQIKDAAKVLGDGFTISAAMSKRDGYEVAPAEFRNFRLTMKGAK